MVVEDRKHGDALSDFRCRRWRLIEEGLRYEHLSAR
jgi:hypothetical protein